MPKVKHEDLPQQEPDKVVFVYDGQEYVLEGQDLLQWVRDSNTAVALAHIHGTECLYKGIEWEKKGD